jgi:hypothetical protein
MLSFTLVESNTAPTFSSSWHVGAGLVHHPYRPHLLFGSFFIMLIAGFRGVGSSIAAGVILGDALLSLLHSHQHTRWFDLLAMFCCLVTVGAHFFSPFSVATLSCTVYLAGRWAPLTVFFKTLRKLGPVLQHTLQLLFCVLYFYSCVSVFCFSSSMAEFGTLSEALIHTFDAVLGSWSSQMTLLQDAGYPVMLVAVYFLSFYFFGILITLNLVQALVLLYYEGNEKVDQIEFPAGVHSQIKIAKSKQSWRRNLVADQMDNLTSSEVKQLNAIDKYSETELHERYSLITAHLNDRKVWERTGRSIFELIHILESQGHDYDELSANNLQFNQNRTGELIEICKNGKLRME